MTDEQTLVYVRGMCLAAEIRMHGMLEENKHRVACGESIAYGEDAFIALIGRLMNDGRR